MSFYSGVFGWRFKQWHETVAYWTIETGSAGEPGIDGGLLPRRGALGDPAVPAYICTIEVEDLDQTLKTAQAMGAALVRPRLAIPGIGWLAYLKDTEGNTFGIMQADPQAQWAPGQAT